MIGPLEAPPVQASPRSQQPRKQPVSEEEAAAQIASAIIAGATVASVGPVLIGVIPPPILSLDSGEIAADIAREAATISIQDAPERPSSSDADESTEWFEELTFRGLYAVSVVRRLAAAVTEGSTWSERRKLLAKAVEAEKRFFAQHREAQKRRAVARRRGREAVAKWGAVVSWVHGKHRIPDQPRPNHLAANGRNFRPALGPPLLTGSLPGVEPGCTCDYGPAKEAASVMAGSLREEA